MQKIHQQCVSALEKNGNVSSITYLIIIMANKRKKTNWQTPSVQKKNFSPLLPRRRRRRSRCLFSTYNYTIDRA